MTEDFKDVVSSAVGHIFVAGVIAGFCTALILESLVLLFISRRK